MFGPVQFTLVLFSTVEQGKALVEGHQLLQNPDTPQMVRGPGFERRSFMTWISRGRLECQHRQLLTVMEFGWNAREVARPMTENPSIHPKP